MKNFPSRKRTLPIFGLILLLLAGICFFLFHKDLPASEDARFEKFTQKLFQEELCSNTLNLHYTLAYPETYGIRDYKVSLGTAKISKMKKNAHSIRRLQQKLNHFSPSELSAKNKMLYDILRLEFSTQLLGSSHYLLQEPLSPNLGIQAQLPVLLAEYTFRTAADIKDYFSLLCAVPDYFDELLAFEQEKSRQGLFMNDTAVDGIAAQCSSFIQNKEEHYLYDAFSQQIQKLLTDRRINEKQAASYIEMNQKLLKEFVFPAYEALSQGLIELKGSGKNEGGLAKLPDGKAYYEYLIRNNVGDYRPIEEMEQQLYRRLLSDYDKIQLLQQKDPALISKAAGLSTASSHSPEQMLDYLKHRMADDFPSLTVENYDVKYVPKSMEKFSSPAFYLTPPIDTLSPNTIYINQSSPISQAELFTTLAHEGFPGHMYQTLYFGKQNTAPLRELLTCGGYVEGWATYVESLSYEYGAAFLGIEPEVMQFLNLNRSVSLCLYSILDIGIHYKGWDLKVVTDTLSAFGITQEDVCKDIFQYIIENPSNYLKYYLGYLNFDSLRQTVCNLQGGDFSLKKFHQNLLEIGPAPFPVVKKYLLMRY